MMWPWNRGRDRALAEFDRRLAEIEAATPRHLVEEPGAGPLPAYRVLTDAQYEEWKRCQAERAELVRKLSETLL